MPLGTPKQKLKKQGKAPTKWTSFWDMHSGGDLKTEFAFIFIEAPEGEAKIVFYNRFGFNPERISCSCCGGDYSIDEDDSLEQMTGFHRGCRAVEQKRGEDGLCKPLPKGVNYYLEAGEDPPPGFTASAGWREGKYQTLAQFLKGTSTMTEPKAKICVIRAKDIKPEERIGTVPEEGWVWR